MDVPLHGLFDKRVAGDDALLALAQRRFEQAGLAAEMYADGPEDLERVLRFAPAGTRAPLVHLSRGLDLLRERDREAVELLARRFGNRVCGFVVHDRAAMPHRLGELAQAGAQLSRALTASGTASLFLEYAAGVTLEEFVAVGDALAPFDQVGLCIDVGHVGLREVRRRFADLAPHVTTDVADLRTDDPRLPALLDTVTAAMAAGLPAVESLTAALAEQTNPVHYHVHDGHPLVPGLSDHFPFQWRLPIPFSWNGLASLATLYGVTGLARILQAAGERISPERLSLTLEIHQGFGRLDLDPQAAPLFAHWSDLEAAERQNGWLAVVTESAELVRGLHALARDPVS